MSLFIASLNSGSNGNCYYIGNEHDAILIDAGISCRETVKRMKRIGLSIDKVRAIFISHEHGDHISGVTVLSKRYQLPVYITQQTRIHGNLRLEDNLVASFKAFEPIVIGALSITPFPKFHDAVDPHSFIVQHAGITVGIFTDIGTICNNLTVHFKQCHAAFLEANYDTEMLENGGYPYHLKKRIRGGEGHLSNSEALSLFRQHKPGFMSHLFLSHLSKNNNTPELALDLFKEHSGDTEIIVASRYTETPVYQIDTTGQALPVRVRLLKPKQRKHELQLSLFGL